MAQVAAAVEVKKPPSAYWLWLESARGEITQEIGSRKGSEVGKAAGEKWKKMPADDKAPWEAKAKERKEAFEKFKATEEGQKALQEKNAARKEHKQQQDDKLKKKMAKTVERTVKKMVKAIEKDDKLKKPASAYFLFASEKREEVQKMLGTKDLGPVAKKVTELWKEMSEADKKPFEDKARTQKDDYEIYIKSPEGAAALQTYKDRVKQVKASAKQVEPKREQQQQTPNKRAKRGGEFRTPTPKKQKAAAAPEPSVPLDAKVLEEAASLGYEAQLRNLAGRGPVASTGASASQLLAVLKKSQGLVNKAQQDLVGHGH